MTSSGRTARLVRIVAAGIMVLTFAGFGVFRIIPSLLVPQVVENTLPTDPMPTCVVTSAVFATWFQSGSPTLDGLVNPADSVTFPNMPNCSFYQWSEQMFLWLTSPVGSDHVFSTSTFFDVSPPNNVGARTFIPHPLPAVINVEQDQFGGPVLEAQTAAGGSLVYYITSVNDVYAYLATGLKISPPAITLTNFPTTQTDLNQITAFAASHGVTFPDPNALAIIVKSSWVLAAGLPNLSTYITTTATIPTYDMSNPAQWIPNGQQTVQLALVGMHVVGSAAGHPEMIWATFEHMDNAPRGEYSYINTSSNTVTVDEDPSASWVFTSTSSAGPFNCLHMQLNFAGDVNAVSPTSPCPANAVVSPSDTIRWKAFGAASDGSPNPLDGSAAASNTEIISINNSVLGMLISPDVRGNYVMTGATWTIGGAVPNRPFQQIVSGLHGNEVGTSVLSNATIETYLQGVNNTLANGGQNCFTCHTTSSGALNVSHDFGNLLALTSFSPNPGYTLGSFPADLFAEHGALAATQITVLPQNGFKGDVKFSASGMPKGVKATFNPKSTFTSTTLTLTSSKTAPAGVSTVQILGKSGQLSSFTSVSLTVTAESFSLSASPNALTIDQNSSGKSTITIFPVDGFSGNVKLTTSKLPVGVSAMFSPNPATSTSTLGLTVSAKAQTGTFPITIKGVSGTLKANTTLTLTVDAGGKEE